MSIPVVPVAALIGAIWGGHQARRRGGGGKDIAQYAVVYAIIFAILAMFAVIIIDRSFG